MAEKRAHLDQSDDEELETDSHAAELVAGKVDGASIGFEELSLSVLMVGVYPVGGLG